MRGKIYHSYHQSPSKTIHDGSGIDIISLSHRNLLLSRRFMSLTMRPSLLCIYKAENRQNNRHHVFNIFKMSSQIYALSGGIYGECPTVQLVLNIIFCDLVNTIV